METASLSCATGVTIGLSFLCFGPIFFLGIASFYIRRHMNAEDMKFEYTSTPTLHEIRSRMSKGKGLAGKLFLVFAYLRSGVQDRGEWEDSKSTAYWGFLICDFCQTFWIYSLWLLFKRIWVSMALNWFDGALNAALMSAVQFLDMGLLLFLRPYVSRKTEMTETLGSITNTLSFLAISVPILAPDFPLPSWLGDYTNMMLATFGTVISAIFSLTTPLVMLAKGLRAIFAKLGWSCLGTGGFATYVQVTIVNNLEDEIADQLEDGMLKESEDQSESSSQVPSIDNEVIFAGGVLLGGAAAMASAPFKPDGIKISISLRVQEADTAFSQKRKTLHDQVIQDVSDACDPGGLLFSVKSTGTGTVIELVMHCQHSHDVGKGLESQARDSTSRLRHGNLTRHVLSLHVQKSLAQASGYQDMESPATSRTLSQSSSCASHSSADAKNIRLHAKHFGSRADSCRNSRSSSSASLSSTSSRGVEGSLQNAGEVGQGFVSDHGKFAGSFTAESSYGSAEIYICEAQCGFEGTYEEVEAHELVCPKKLQEDQTTPFDYASSMASLSGIKTGGVLSAFPAMSMRVNLT